MPLFWKLHIKPYQIGAMTLDGITVFVAGPESLEDLWIGNTWWVQLWVSWVKPWKCRIYLSYCYSLSCLSVCLTTLFQLQYIYIYNYIIIIYNMSSWIIFCWHQFVLFCLQVMGIWPRFFSLRRHFMQHDMFQWCDLMIYTVCMYIYICIYLYMVKGLHG